MNKLKNISLPRTYTQLLQWVSYLWAATICFPDLQGTFYGVFALLLWGVFRGHLVFSFNYCRSTENNRCLSDGLSLSKSAAEERSSVPKAEECIENRRLSGGLSLSKSVLLKNEKKCIEASFLTIS